MRLWRSHRDDAQVLVEMARALAYRRGPFRAWRLMQARPLPATAGADVVADWHSLRAYVLGSLRDFDGAERAHREALELDRGEAWLHVEWAYVCEQRDADAEAVEAAEHALALRPGYRAALQALAHLYTLVGRDADALALLAKSVAESQSGGLAMQLLELQVEHDEHAAAARTLADIERFSPLADKALRQWMHARRADLALGVGRAAEARDEAQRAGGEFYERLAARLAEPAAAARRVVLPVGFVRQHAVTCAPATLATLSRYWGHEAAHLDIAEKICYDGTPNHSERHWSEDQGFVTREFTVDWDTACKLLDAGVPFTLTTVYTASAHLQAVIGYDALRGTLLIRDPFKRTPQRVRCGRAVRVARGHRATRHAADRCVAGAAHRRHRAARGVDLGRLSRGDGGAQPPPPRRGAGGAAAARRRAGGASPDAVGAAGAPPPTTTIR